MGHKADRERAQKGLLFRNGKLATKKEPADSKEKLKVSPDKSTELLERAARLAGIPSVKHMIKED